jgi:hypothetical protein
MHSIKAWSYSRLTDFEACPYRAKLKYLDRIPEPLRPLPVGKLEHANDRGSRVHEAAELYVRGGVELVPELRGRAEGFGVLRELFKADKVDLEGEWAFSREWSSVAWQSEDAWCRMKLDALVRESSTHARVIDFKTGKILGNEIKHTEQGQLYQLATFIRFPDLETIDVEFWYVDHPIKDDVKTTYTRQQGTRYFDKYHSRGAKLTDCLDYKPNPNVYSCKWCPYLDNACEYGVKRGTVQAPRKVYPISFEKPDSL